MKPFFSKCYKAMLDHSIFGGDILWFYMNSQNRNWIRIGFRLKRWSKSEIVLNNFHAIPIPTFDLLESHIGIGGEEGHHDGLT